MSMVISFVAVAALIAVGGLMFDEDDWKKGGANGCEEDDL